MLVVIVLCIVFVLILNNTKISEYFTMERIKSNIDNREYSVVTKYKDRAQAADLIANINQFTAIFIKTMQDKYISTKYYESTSSMSVREYDRGNEITTVLLRRFNPEALQENEPDSIDKTSYTTNKGEVISLCLREKISGKNEFHDISVLQFVLLHEIAHIVTPELNHSILFWTNFRFLLDFCNKYGLYTSQMYDSRENKVNYCGLNISYNPVSDLTLQTFF